MQKSVVVWLSGSMLVSINVVTLRRARLVVGDRLWAGKPSQYVTSHLGQLSLPSLRGKLIECHPFWLGLGGARSPVSGDM